MIHLKTFSFEAVPAALDMAKSYRLLNEPDEAESICLDILEAVPDHAGCPVALERLRTVYQQSSGTETR